MLMDTVQQAYLADSLIWENTAKKTAQDEELKQGRVRIILISIISFLNSSRFWLVLKYLRRVASRKHKMMNWNKDG